MIINKQRQPSEAVGVCHCKFRGSTLIETLPLRGTVPVKIFIALLIPIHCLWDRKKTSVRESLYFLQDFSVCAVKVQTIQKAGRCHLPRDSRPHEGSVPVGFTIGPWLSVCQGGRALIRRASHKDSPHMNVRTRSGVIGFQYEAATGKVFCSHMSWKHIYVL